MNEPLQLLDLCSGGGGAARGYQRAGFDTTGVDSAPQPYYPGRFIQSDMFTVLDDTAFVEQFDAIHVSTPCHDYSALASISGLDGTAWMLEHARDPLRAIGKPYVLENVPGAPMPGALVLCGSEFGLSAHTAARGRVFLRRHRLFESNIFLMGAGGCYCSSFRGRTITVVGNGTGGKRGWKGTSAAQREAMDLELPRKYLSQAIPPAYTEHIGHQLAEHIRASRKA